MTNQTHPKEILLWPEENGSPHPPAITETEIQVTEPLLLNVYEYALFSPYNRLYQATLALIKDTR